MAERLPRRRTGAIGNVTGITGSTCNNRAGVIGVGGQKTLRRVTVTTLSIGNDVGFVFAYGYDAGVATGAYRSDIRMIEAAIRLQFYKTDGIVAAVTFGICWLVELGFADGLNTVMTLAAISEYFLVISKGDNIETLRRMTGLAHITACDMILRFSSQCCILIVMTIYAV